MKLRLKITGSCVFLCLSLAFPDGMFLGTQEDALFLNYQSAFGTGTVTVEPWAGVASEGGFDVAASWYYTFYDNRFEYRTIRSISVKSSVYPLKGIENDWFGLSLTGFAKQTYVEKSEKKDRRVIGVGSGIYKRLDLHKFLALVPSFRYSWSSSPIALEEEPTDNNANIYSISIPVLFYIKYMQRSFISLGYDWDDEDTTIFRVSLGYLFLS
ncbi:hypothetical protein ACFL5V_08565 [Fibrobacterota bacterium]